MAELVTIAAVARWRTCIATVLDPDLPESEDHREARFEQAHREIGEAIRFVYDEFLREQNASDVHHRIEWPDEVSAPVITELE